MTYWQPFKLKNIAYDLSHLDNSRHTHTRAATETHPEKKVSFLLTYTNHCFTDHYGEEGNLYHTARDGKQRFFCTQRYQLSKNLPDLIKKILTEDPYMKMTFSEHREQFFYLEDKRLEVDYRLFLELSKLDHTSDVRIKVASAYPPDSYAKSVGYQTSYKLWRVIDARMEGIQLSSKRRR